MFWVESLIWNGYKKPISQEFLWDLPNELTSQHITEKWEKHWQDYTNDLSKYVKMKTYYLTFKNFVYHMLELFLGGLI